MASPFLYPTFLKLASKRVVLVGGGRVAASKLGSLVESGARVTVVAPEIGAAIRHAAAALVERAFEPADLDGAWYVVAAAPPEVNRAVVEAADARRIFVNAVDDPAHATAYAGGVVRRDGVTIAISTTGEAPALAGLLREGIDAMLPEDLDVWVEAARQMRTGWREEKVPMEARRPLLLEALWRLYAARRQAVEDSRWTTQPL